MALLKTLTFLKRQNPSHFHKPLHRTLCTSLQIEPHLCTETDDSDQTQETQMTKSNQKPLDALFKEAVGLSPKPEDCDIESESESESNELKKRLKNLEREVSELRVKSEEKARLKKKKGKKVLEGEPSSAKKLHALFTEKTKPVALEEFKDLSPEIQMFVSHLYRKGYFKDVNFLPRNRLDFSCFSTEYSRAYIKSAALRFGRDHPEITQSLSSSDLKKVVLFGCPALNKKDVFAAKRLRKFFEIQEDTVCCKCILKESCPFVNMIAYEDVKTMCVGDIMRIITLHALESFPPPLVVPEEVKVSVTRLLNEIVKPSKTVS